MLKSISIKKAVSAPRTSFVTIDSVGKNLTKHVKAALKIHSKNTPQYDQQQPKRFAVFFNKVGNQ